jgi:hypothetical protein
LTPDGTLFILEKPFEGRGKWLFTWYAVSFLVPTIFFAYVSLLSYSDDGFASLILLAVVVVFGIVGYRYLSRSWSKDTLLVTASAMILTEQKGLRRLRREFQRSAISELRWLEKPVIAPHPLAGKAFDYLGFQTQEQVIGALFADHRIAFDYQGQTISFGGKLYSWDYDAIRGALLGTVPVEAALPWNEPPSWDSYWTSFDVFVASLSLQKQSHIIREAEAVRHYVNALTDRWADHRQALKELRMRFGDQLSEQQKGQLDELIAFQDDVPDKYP